MLLIGNETQKNYCTSNRFTIKEFGRLHLKNSPLSALDKRPSFLTAYVIYGRS